jgi:hypothetical protein
MPTWNVKGKITTSSPLQSDCEIDMSKLKSPRLTRTSINILLIVFFSLAISFSSYNHRGFSSLAARSRSNSSHQVLHCHDPVSSARGTHCYYYIYIGTSPIYTSCIREQNWLVKIDSLSCSILTSSKHTLKRMGMILLLIFSQGISPEV